MAKPASFNDPFDCAISLDPEKLSESIRDVSEELLKLPANKKRHSLEFSQPLPSDIESYEQFTASVRDLMGRGGVLCLSAEEDNMLMWSHYASHHNGFCVEYDNSDGTLLREMAHPVKYSVDIPSLSSADLKGPSVSLGLNAMWLTKATCWEYEKEWRALSSEGNKCYQAPSPTKAIIFGARMSEADKIMITYALRNNPSVSFKQASVGTKKFGIEIVTL